MIAGEPSGDVIGADLIRGLLAESKEPVEIVGIGGPLMEAAGMKVLLPMNALAVMGLSEVIRHLPRLHKIYVGVIAEIRKFKPHAVVTVDFPDFNFLVGKAARKMGGIKVIHYVAPTVWAWRPGRAKKVSRFLHGLICLYPFEPPYFKKHKLKAIYAGHPLVEADLANVQPARLRQRTHIAENTRTLGLFFGSRAHELSDLSPVLKEAALIVLEKYPDTQVIVPTLPHLEFEVRKILSDVGDSFHVVSDPVLKWDTFACCDAAIAVSGTVGLELSWLNVPHVIAYKMGAVTTAVGKMIVKTKRAHLTNIILNEDLVPEFLHGNFKAEKIAEAVIKIYEDPAAVEKQREGFERMRQKMTDGVDTKPSQKAARFVLHVLGKK